MDRETTQRLLRESIVFLCKTHLGQDACSGFEVDAIICVSRHSDGNNMNVGYNDPRPIVFKFHEHVTQEDGESVENVNDWLSSGSSQSFVNGLLRQSDWPKPPAAKRRKTGETNDQPTSNFESDTMPVADLSLVKKEPGYLETDELANVNNGAQIDTCTNQPQMTRRLRSADATSFDAGHSSVPDTKEVRNANKDSKTELVSKQAMSSPPPLKLMPGAAEQRRSSNDECVKRPASRNSNCEHHSDAVSDLVDENLDDATSGMEQSTPRSCDLCGLLFADFPTFNVHCATVHSRYACPFCALSFPCESTRERHLFEHTGEQVDDGMANVGTEDDADVSTRSTHCLFNSEFGERQNDYWSDDVAGSIEMPDVEDGTLTAVNGTLYDPQVVTRRGVLSCQTLRAIAQLDPSHPFVCDVCRARFASSSELCDHCTSAHHRIPCPYCGRSFSQKASMERHQRQHTGERPYQCTYCEACYTRKENLQTHMTRMHGASAVQQHDFICVE